MSIESDGSRISLLEATDQELVGYARHEMEYWESMLGGKGIDEIATQYYDQAYFRMAWAIHFRGKVPNQLFIPWWANRLIDESVKKDGYITSPVLLDALLTHPMRNQVPGALSNKQKLSINEIGMALTTMGVDWYGSEDFLAKQQYHHRNRLDVKKIIQQVQQGKFMPGFVFEELPAIACSLDERPKRRKHGKK